MKNEELGLIEKVLSAIEHDLTVWATVGFTCCALILLGVLIDMWAGTAAARAVGERLSSHGFRKTVAKAVDYLRVVFFAALIDTLGLFFPWYLLPYFVMACTLGVLLIEGRSVIENSRKKKSQAAAIPDAVRSIIQAATREEAEKVLEQIDNLKGMKNEERRMKN